jgi:hypothetical protein
MLPFKGQDPLFFFYSPDRQNMHQYLLFLIFIFCSYSMWDSGLWTRITKKVSTRTIRTLPHIVDVS